MDKLSQLMEHMTELKTLLAELVRLERCRYYCRDRGNHNSACEFSKN